MPKALDTNIVVRFLIDDGSKEVPIARAVFRRETVEIPLTVIVECEWVLRAVYKIGRVDICDAFEALLSLPRVIVHDDQIVAGAIDAHRLESISPMPSTFFRSRNRMNCSHWMTISRNAPNE